MLTDYNKFIGTVVGGLVGAVLLYFNIPGDVVGPELTSWLTTIVMAGLGTYFAPKNTN